MKRGNSSLGLIAEIVPGEFPIDAWHPILLEIPDGGSTAHMSGRVPGLLSSSVSPVKRSRFRTINLPIYEDTKGYRLENLGRVKAWNRFSQAVPVVTLASRYDGYYCDQRRAQAVLVLPVWADGTSRLLELDWCEGPLEDCANPEWHLRASPPFQVKDGADRIREICRNPPMWEDCSFYLYVIPSFLGSHLLGKGNRTPSNVWQREWKYSEHAEMLNALNQIITTIMTLGSDEINQKRK